VADEELPPDKADAKPSFKESGSLGSQQQALVSTINNWINLELARRFSPHSLEADRKTWLATADYLFALANILGSSVPDAVEPLRFAGLGIVQSLAGHAPRVFNPPKPRGRQPHSLTQNTAKGVAVAYVLMAEDKKERLIIDEKPRETICDFLSISHETLDDWMSAIYYSEPHQRLYSILSGISDPEQRLSITKVYVRVANIAYRYGL
jgi:hypothetical protein